MKTYQITLPAEDAELVDKMLQDGPWASVDALFLDGLGTLQADVIAEEEMNLDYDEVREKLRVGIEQLERGETVDGEEVFSRILARLEVAQAQPVS